MLLRKMTLFAIAFAGISVAAGPSMAADPGLPLTIRPLQGVSFDIGTKRAVSYFLSDDHACKLTFRHPTLSFGGDRHERSAYGRSGDEASRGSDQCRYTNRLKS
jgi:hypothetical protein